MTSPPELPDWISLGPSLGSGSFGVVYEAFDHRQQAAVALKTLHAFDAEALTDLKREFRLMADIAHPNLVTLYDLEVHATVGFITMERVHGVPLQAYLDSHPGEARLRDVFAQLSSAISALHEAGVVHRDLKPSNILVTRDGRVVVLDFGLALEWRRRPGTASAAGSLRYMSPEQLEGGALSRASDWYSFGLILYEALGGTALFDGALAVLMRRRLAFDPAPDAVLVPSAPADLDRLCRVLLARDPARRPMAAEIARHLACEPPTACAEASLIGRAAELATLRAALDGVRRGTCAVVHLRGRSGFGKTRLAHEFLAAVDGGPEAPLQFRGRCYEQESVPYKVFDGVIDELSAYLRHRSEDEWRPLRSPDGAALERLFPQLRGLAAATSDIGVGGPEVGSPALRRRAGVALRELLRRLAPDRVVVLLLDDLQWGDQDSIILLEELLRDASLPLLLLAVYRSEDAAANPFLQAFARLTDLGTAGHGRYDIDVPPLTPPQARELAAALLEGSDADQTARADAIARAATGSPLFVAELARAGGTATSRRATLEEVIRARVAGLPEAARRLLEIVAVAGQRVPIDVAQQAAALPGQRHPAVALLRRSHLIRTHADRGVGAVEPLHDRIREVVVAALPAAMRQIHHGALAMAWERHGEADPETLAVHLAAAGDLVRAGSLAAQAADAAAAALAFDRAARLYRWGLEIGQIDADERQRCLVHLAEALANAGRGAVAAATYLEAASGADRAAALDLRRRAAEQYLISGYIEDGLATLHDVLGMVGLRLAATPRRALLSLLVTQVLLAWRGLDFEPRDAAALDPEDLLRIDTCWSAAIGLSLVDTLRGAEFVGRQLRLALRAGEPYRAARAMALQLGGSVVRGRRAARRTAELERRTWEAARLADHPHALALATANSAAVLSYQGSFAASLTRGEEAERLLRDRCVGVRWERDVVEVFRLHSLNWMGRWRELGERIPLVLQDADDRGDRYLATYVRTRAVHLVHLAGDRPALARTVQVDAIGAWSQPPFQVQHYWNWLACTEIALYEGAGKEAWERVSADWPMLVRSALAYVQPILIETRWLRARAALAQAARLEREGGARQAAALLRVAECDAARIEQEGTRWGDALAALARAGIAMGRGDRDRAATYLAMAEQRCAGTNMRQYAAAARRRRGALLAGDAGTAALADADAWMAGEGIREPSRMVDMLAPGAWRA